MVSTEAAAISLGVGLSASRSVLLSMEGAISGWVLVPLVLVAQGARSFGGCEWDSSTDEAFSHVSFQE